MLFFDRQIIERKCPMYENVAPENLKTFILEKLHVPNSRKNDVEALANYVIEKCPHGIAISVINPEEDEVSFVVSSDVEVLVGISYFGYFARVSNNRRMNSCEISIGDVDVTVEDFLSRVDRATNIVAGG